jgi:hypothetical protein
MVAFLGQKHLLEIRVLLEGYEGGVLKFWFRSVLFGFYHYSVGSQVYFKCLDLGF